MIREAVEVVFHCAFIGEAIGCVQAKVSRAAALPATFAQHGLKVRRLEGFDWERGTYRSTLGGTMARKSEILMKYMHKVWIPAQIAALKKDPCMAGALWIEDDCRVKEGVDLAKVLADASKRSSATLLGYHDWSVQYQGDSSYPSRVWGAHLVFFPRPALSVVRQHMSRVIYEQNHIYYGLDTFIKDLLPRKGCFILPSCSVATQVRSSRPSRW